jgi:DNA-binding NarL/FixJ family response regulator
MAAIPGHRVGENGTVVEGLTPPMAPISVLVVDDQWLVRAGLVALLGDFDNVEVVGEAGDGNEALALVADLAPSIVLMDITMPRLNGLEATRRIAREHPASRVIVLSGHSGEQFVLEAMNAGASGYALKGSAPAELAMAIQAVARGELFLSPAISKHVVRAVRARDGDSRTSIGQLTPRQREILQLIAEGKSSKQIAQLLDAGVKTIEAHRANLMARLNIHDVAGLVRYAIRHGLISAEE